MFFETPVQEDPLTNSKHAEDDILSKAGDFFYSRREYGTAQRLYQLAAIDNNGFREKGSSYAKLKLGYIYHHFTSTDMGLSLKYYHDAYRSGRAEAGNNIGCLVFNGKFTPKDLRYAFQYFLDAATNGNMYAQYNTGRCYKKGFGIQKDLMKALEWYTKSADQGFELAKDRVSWLNKKGYFIERNVGRRNTIDERRLTLIKREYAQHTKAGTLANQAQLVANMNLTSPCDGVTIL